MRLRVKVTSKGTVRHPKKGDILNPGDVITIDMPKAWFDRVEAIGYYKVIVSIKSKAKSSSLLDKMIGASDVGED